MLKRILPIAILTGTGQLFSLFALKYVSRSVSALTIQMLGQFDSMTLFLISAIALGLQTTAMRDLALSDDWKLDYQRAQSARLTLGLLLCAGSLFYFFNSFYLVFLIAPLIALNGDYALYARSHPVIGAWIGFSRLFIPGLAIVLAARFFPERILLIYILSTMLVYLLSNLYINRFLKTVMLAAPSFKNLHLYVRSLPLGIVILALYFIGQGLILVIPYFYPNSITAAAYVGLKFYVLFKGVLRIVHQAFIREMNHYTVCFEVDQLASLAGFAFAVFTLSFPDSFIQVFFGVKYLTDKNYFILLSIAGLIYSMFSSFIIKAMLEKKDMPYAIGAMVSAVLTVLLCVAFSYYRKDISTIGFSLVLGELGFALFMINLVRGAGLLKERLLFFFKNIPFALIPWLFSYFMGDRIKVFAIAASVYALMLTIIYYRKFAVARPLI